MDEIIKEEASFFNFKAIFKELKRHLVKILAVVVAFAVLGGVYGLFFADLTYASEASVIAFDDEVYADENEEIDVIQRVASSAKTMITSASGNRVFENVEKILKEKGVVITIKQMKNELTVTNNSMFILFAYETANSDAQLILDTIVTEFLKVLNEKDAETGKYVMTMFGGKLKVFTSATPIEGDGGLTSNLILYLALFAIVGGVLSVAVVVLLALLRNTVLDKETIENDFEIEVLTVVEELNDKRVGR